MPKKQIERVWLLGALVAAFLLVLIGYTMFISPQNSKTSNARAQVSTANTTNRRLQARLNSLREQSKNLSKYQAELTAAEFALPTTSGLPDFLRTLQSIGNATLAQVSAFSVGAPTDVTPIAGAAGASRVSSTSKSSSGSASSSATTLNGVRVYSLPITATVTGSTGALEAFLTQLQTVQPRAVLISQLTETSGQTASGAPTKTASAGSNTLGLTMQAFVAPASSAERASLSTQSSSK
jgi:hypothetical protein